MAGLVHPVLEVGNDVGATREHPRSAIRGEQPQRVRHVLADEVPAAHLDGIEA